MMRPAQIVIALMFVLGLALFVGWEKQRISRAGTAEGVLETIHSLTGRQAASGPRPLEDPAYSNQLAQVVSQFVAQAPHRDAAGLAAAEQSLPTDALPLLQELSSHGSLPSDTANQLLDALTADGPRCKLAARRQKNLQWYRDGSLKIFDRHVPPDAPGAAEAWDVVSAAIRQRSGDFACNGDEGVTIWNESNQAMSEGCHDPLLVYIAAQTLSVYSGYVRQTDQLSREAQEGMATSDYPPYFKLIAALRAAQHLAWTKPTGDHEKRQIQQLIELSRRLFPDVVADADMPRDTVVDLFDIIGQTSYAVYGDRQTLVRPFLKMLDSSEIDRSTALTAEGQFYEEYAWDARGTGWASTVTESSWRLMAQRLEKADATLEEAWKLDSSNASAATLMMDVELGQNQGRDSMELWFKRAMQADPDHYSACEHKLNYLEPKWFGSVPDMIAFGRELAGRSTAATTATGWWQGVFGVGTVAKDSAPSNPDWVAGLPYILVEAHLRAAQYMSNGWKNEPDPEYFKNNPEVWDDVHFVFVQYLAHRPPSVHWRLMYAKLAGWCGHWAEAHDMFSQVGDVFDWTVFRTQAEENTARDQAAQQARTAGQPEH